MQNTVTISHETFTALLSFTKSAQNNFKDQFKNSSRQLDNFPNEKLWQDSVKFWQEEMQNAANTYKKALEEAFYP